MQKFKDGIMKALLILFTFISTSAFSQEFAVCNDNAAALIGVWTSQKGNLGKVEKITFYPNGLITVDKGNTLQQQTYKVIRENQSLKIEIGSQFGRWAPFDHFYVSFNNPRQMIVSYVTGGKTSIYRFEKTGNIKSGIISLEKTKEDNLSI